MTITAPAVDVRFLIRKLARFPAIIHILLTPMTTCSSIENIYVVYLCTIVTKGCGKYGAQKRKCCECCDVWCACSSATPPHEPVSKTKFDSQPCAACDFGRRRKQLGFDVALQMCRSLVNLADSMFQIMVRFSFFIVACKCFKVCRSVAEIMHSNCCNF